jgi:DNA (cytosine-5)-methyltransferase 1
MASRTLTHLSLFSGIGGIDLAAEWTGFETIAFCEKDTYCQKVLRKHWPEVPIIEDVKDVTKERIDTYCKCLGRTQGAGEDIQPAEQKTIRQDTGNIRTEVTLISGGFPCQPHSVAGSRKGSSDERDLWPEFRRIIGEIRPRWVLGENVPGLFTSDSRRFFGGILADLASLGYAVGWQTYGAVDVGALHRRNRVFIVGYSPELYQHGGIHQRAKSYAQVPESGNSGSEETDSTINECIRNIWQSEPDVGRVAYGIPSRVDRLKCLGNAVVPQQIYPVLKAIADYERGNL